MLRGDASAMKTESIILSNPRLSNAAHTKTVAVEYREVPSTYDVGRRYEVIVDGDVVGTVESFEYHSWTTYSGSTIRRDLGRPMRWAWHNALTHTYNSPGLYSTTRRKAVAQMLGYYNARKESK